MVNPLQYIYSQPRCKSLKSVHLQRSFFISIHHERIYHRRQSRHNQSRDDVSVEPTKDTALLLEADNKAELIQQLRLHPGAVVILDYTLFDFTGSDELIVLHERFKEADWLLFSDELSVGFLRQVLFSSMAFGVVLKDNSKEEILTALQCASRKERFICNHVSNLLLARDNRPPTPHSVQDALLTPAERSILKEIALGKTTKEIAAERNLSFHTVNSHRKTFSGN